MNVFRFLQKERVACTAHQHRATASAREIARVMHEPRAHVAKVVLLKADGRFIVVVLQATRQVDLESVRQALGVPFLSVVPEGELIALFPDCEMGAVPPFGSQYGLLTVVDRKLAGQPHMLFAGNSRDETIRMRYCDYERLEHPAVADVSCRRAKHRSQTQPRGEAS